MRGALVSVKLKAPVAEVMMLVNGVQMMVGTRSVVHCTLNISLVGASHCKVVPEGATVTRVMTGPATYPRLTSLGSKMSL